MNSIFRSTKRAVIRAERYGSSLVWVLRQNLLIRPVLFFAVVGASVVARIGPLLGFIVTIKALAVLLAPEYGTRVFSGLEKFGLPETVSRALIIVAPFVAFCVAAIGIWISSILIERLIRQVASEITKKLGVATIVNAFRIREARTRRGAIEPDTLGDGEDDIQIDMVMEAPEPATADADSSATASNKASRYVSDYSLAIRRFHRIERQFLMMCEVATVLTIVAFLGLYINAGFMALVLAAGVAFGAFIVPFNQRRSHLLADRVADLTASLRESISLEAENWSRQNPASQTVSPGYEKISNLAQRSTAQPVMFRSQARMVGIILQGLIIMCVLFVIAVEYSASPGNVAQLGIMIVMVRYVLGTAQTMSNIAIGFGQDYPYLVEIINQAREPSPSDAAPGAS